MGISIKHCSVAEANSCLCKPHQLIDVREYSEYSSQHIKGSIHLPLSELDQHVELIAKDRPVYLVCQSGKRALKAAEYLTKEGYVDLNVIEGGIQMWKQSGYPIEKGASSTWSLERQVRFAAGLLVSLGLLLSLLFSWGLLLSAFIGIGLMFSAITDTCGMGMLLARMPWNKGKSNRGSVACVKS
jgi:rhodanese-related sulfurtransferase